MCIVKIVLASDYDLRLLSNSPVVIGGTVNFQAFLYYRGKVAEGDFKYYWEDNALTKHTRTNISTFPYDFWNVTYSTDSPPGPYEIQVTAYKDIYDIYYTPITSQRLYFELTDELNGELNILQNNKTTGNFVSNNITAVHEVSLKESDAAYLKNVSKSVLVYWFIDCEYYGVTDDFKYEHHYNQTDVQHHVEALIVAGYEPVTSTTPPTTSTTSTTTPTTTTSSTTTTTTPSTITTPKGSTTFTAMPERESIASKNGNITITAKAKRSVNYETTKVPHEILYYSGNNLTSSNKQFNPEAPFVCNKSVVPISTNNTYGYFSKSFIVKAPVSKLTINGNNWIKQSNILHLQISCKGSKPFQYCLNYFPGNYNITGNETCINPLPLDNCDFEISRYYGYPGPHTIVVIIINDVDKLITPITVTVYEVAKQAQLSVIVVPVTFSIVAIVLIIFGVAYYLQNRSRFTVEVADFNFGPQYADYMTFRERLRDSIMNSFTRATVNTEDNGSGPIWPPNQKYGSMPRF
ncbi:hypothetical protein Trydic_g16758 [Trypoxylus dichotomus]